MLVRSFVGPFSHWDRVPVEPEEDVKPALLERIPNLQIEIYPDPGLDIGKSRGIFECFESVEDGVTRRTAHVTFSTRQPVDWQRLAACKEMLHVLDPVDLQVAKAEEIADLIKKVVKSPNRDDYSQDGSKAISDHIGLGFAVAVMFPFAARALMLQKYSEGRLTLDQIHAEVGIPREWIISVLSPIWLEVHAGLLSLK